MRFLFLTMEATNNSALKQAALVLNRTYGCGLEVIVYNLGLHRSEESWQKLQTDIAVADFIFGSMLFSEDIVRPLESLLSEAECPVCIITSNPALIHQTRIGKFSLQKLSEEKQPSGLFGELASRLRPKNSHGEKERQLSLVRNISRVMKHIPGRARDIHTFIASHQFWLNGSDENMQRFLSLLVSRYVPSFSSKLPQKDPVFYPDTALCHPEAREPFNSSVRFREWLETHRTGASKGLVALLAMRATVLGNNMRHLEYLSRSLEAKGIDTVIVYSGGLDFRPAIHSFFGKKNNGRICPDIIINTTGFSLVGGPAESRAEEAVAALRKSGVPYLTLVPLSFQSIRQWKSGAQGLAPLQTALSVAVPELDGAIEPHVFAGAEETGDRTVPLETEIDRLAERLLKQLCLKDKQAEQKKIAVVLFNFPPNLGNAGTAAYLNVFESLYTLLEELQKSGYTVRLPENSAALREELLEGNRHVFGTDGNVAEQLPVEDYRSIAPYYHEIESFWGDAPGELLNDGKRFHILGRTFGNIFIGQQPSFGYERDPMRLLMAKDAAPNHAFAAFYSWLEHVWQADAVVHFGTHGALEFMPGKQVGLGLSCWPKRLIGSMPHFYYYCVNNPSEGAIAKRRGFATLISYLCPPLEQAGLYKGFRRLRELIESCRRKEDPEILDEIKGLAKTLELETQEGNLSVEGYLTALNAELYLIEERMIPLGLHVIGKDPEPESLVDQLVRLAAYPLATLDGRSLHEIICTRRDIDYEQLAETSEHDRDSEHLWREIIDTSRETVRLFIGNLPVNNKSRHEILSMAEASFRVRALTAENHLRRSTPVRHGELEAFWSFLQKVFIALISNNEIKGILDALAGKYIEPSPGNDLARNPDIVPTGRNIHSLDPFSIPSSIAWKRGQAAAEALLADYRKENGCLPESTAIILWGTDNIKSDGEGIAQALALLGAKPKTDELGKISDVVLIPLEELSRPRIDVVITVSGIFRDLLSHQIRLLDKAVRLAASAEEPETLNFVRRNVLEQCREDGLPFNEAANRIFSNAPGSYGANVNHLVESSTWETDNELSETFISRKSFSFSAEGAWQESPEILNSALRNVKLTYQNIDSLEMGVSDIDHYYEYLGGVSKAVEKVSRSKPGIMVGDVDGYGKIPKMRSLESMVSLEARTKLLNPRWYESMIKNGYEGVREIESRLSNTYGWSATASAVKDWTYSSFNETFLQDREMLEKLRNLNPHATLSMTRRLLEANARGFWKTDEGTIEELQQLYEDLESHVEGLETIS